MIAGQFDVVFRGQIVKSFELERVKDNLVQLFKSSPEAVDKLFSGKEVAIKKALDYTTAMKYQSALKKAGALALIKEIEVASSAENSIQQGNFTDHTKHKPAKAQFGQAQTASSFTDATPNGQSDQSDQSSASSPTSTNSQFPAKETDSNESIAESSSETRSKFIGQQTSSKEQVSIREVSTKSTQSADSASEEGESLTVAEIGASILPDKVYEKRDVDTSALSLAAAGERILPEAERDEPPPPSTDHLSLVDE